MRVLLADDDTSIQKLARITLERIGGCETYTCSSGAEALVAVKVFRPDIVVLDVNMPGMDGPQAIAEIRKFPEMSSIPVVFLTAATQQHEIERYIRIGAAGVIAKPFDPMTFPEKVLEFLRTKDSPQTDTAAKLKILAADYARGLSGKIRDIEKIWKKNSARQLSRTDRDEMRLMVHKMSGSGETFGFPEVSRYACLLEQILKKEKALPEDHARIEGLISALIVEVSAPVLVKGVNEMKRTDKRQSSIFKKDKRLVYFIDDDPGSLEGLVLQLGYFGYTVCSLQPDEFKDAVSREHPSAIIADITKKNSGLLIRGIISDIKKVVPDNSLPVVFISENDDLDSRLSAVRAGGNAYFIKPVDAGLLIDQLDALTSCDAEGPYRVLIVDDDITLAARYELVLRSAGMKTEITSDPMRIMELLGSFSPDLILMDVYMPDSSGLELSMVIRQMATFVSVPIVFLSAEKDIEKQLAAMSLGGDDFLTKPIKDRHLVSSVKSRVVRSRLLRSFMVRDSLTGLLNHTKAKEQLHIGVASAERQNSSLAYAMIDIDHFKAVNDTYGHITGDHVIKSLSRILQQRMRKTDVIGRYGGEEFSVLLAAADAPIAAAIVDKVRMDFAGIAHRCRGVEFYVTFSCGIASFPCYGNPIALHEAADAALYRAKKEGRNRICLAE